MVGVATAEECSDNIAESGSEVEESGLDGGGEMKAGVEDVSDLQVPGC